MLNLAQIKFFIPSNQGNFDITAEPTLEGLAGEDYLGNTVAITDQLINAMDAHPRRRGQADTDNVATVWRVDAEFDIRAKSDFMMLDQHNLRDAYAAAVREQVEINHHSADVFGSATTISPARVISGLMNKRRPYLDLDGSNDYINVSDADKLDVGTTDFALQVHFRPDTVSVNKQKLIHKYAAPVGPLYYGLELREDDLWILLDDDTQNGDAKIGTAICEAGDDVYVWVDFDRNGNATAWIRKNDDDTVLLGTVDISSTSGDLDNTGDFRIGSENSGTTDAFNGRIYSVSKWSALAGSLAQVDLNILGARTANLDASYTCTGLNEGDGKWYDDSGNDLDGTVTTAEFHDTPGGTDYGFYLAEYTKTEDLFWFIRFNASGLTGVASVDALLGQIVIGEMFEFNGLIPDGGFDGDYEYPGITINENETGIVQTEEKYGLKQSWSIGFQLSTPAQFRSLRKMVDLLKGSLYPFYISFNYDQIMPRIYRVRLNGGLKWSYNYGLSQPWLPTLEIVMDI